MFSRNDAGELCLFGFHVFGGWLPFFGWRTYDCHWDGTPALDHVEDGMLIETPAHAKVRRESFLTFEWLGFGFCWGAVKK